VHDRTEAKSVNGTYVSRFVNCNQIKMGSKTAANWVSFDFNVAYSSR